MTEADTQALWLTVNLATSATVILLLICLPLAFWLSKTKSFLKPFIESFLTLPLVLPPTVLGYYLLVAFAASAPAGQWYHALTGHSLAFSYEGILVASIIYSLPFALRPLQSSFEQLPAGLLHTAAGYGFSPVRCFIKIVLPYIRPALFVAATLSFAHTVGEFGIILMIGGSIPGETQVLSVALFNHVEAMNFTGANVLAAIMLFFSFAVLLSCQLWQQKINVTKA